MTNKDYIRNVARLKEIEGIVKNPECNLDKIDALIDETKNIVKACYEYTRSLKDKVESLSDIEPDADPLD